ncbi:hypothetical protein D8674_028534 [Pyrus ussuriensis x Pyrus communis]|uniref:Uncharacterized protein n=1 Tax=Pyrus ussuriensis x Pyrus communis TaxID=2448454 RepID=A0A5N5HZJ2_9ROSA|nr:hypothetical protein D8674_028534 [Pyrus ussuriensis x Pyrus communis]
MLDDVDVDFMMDSEINRRMLVGDDAGLTGIALSSGEAVSCAMQGAACHPGPNRYLPPPRCEQTRYNRECF